MPIGFTSGSRENIFIVRQFLQIDGIERIALSFGLSIALVPLLTFWMNYLFKVKITAANVSLLILGLILAGVAVIYLRGRLAER